MTQPLSRAQKAWATRRSATYRARRTARASQVAFEHWANENGWCLIFLDAASRNPCTGIVDAILLRVRPKDTDQIDVRLVQLKSERAGLMGVEFERLCLAVENINVEGMAAVCNSDTVFTTAVSRAIVSSVKKMRPNQAVQETPRKHRA
jgi:hypothetical protein